MTSRLKKLLIACHPDRHGGDHSRMEEFHRAAKPKERGHFQCLDCPTPVIYKGTRCGVCFQAHRRQKKVLPVALLFLLCVLCASVVQAQPALPKSLRTDAAAAPTLSTNTNFFVSAIPAPGPFRDGLVNLAWNPSPDASVVGYRLYYGVATGVYTNSAAVGNHTNATVRNLLEGVTYYFAATGYDASGVESPFSNETSFLPVPNQDLGPSGWSLTTAGYYQKTNEIVGSTNMTAPAAQWILLKTFVGTGVKTNAQYTNTTQFYFRVRIKGKP